MTQHDECPGLESIAALVDGRLPDADAARLRAHVAGCPACFELTRETMHFLSAEAAGARPRIGPPDADRPDADRPFSRVARHAVWWSVAALLAVVAGLQIARRVRDDGVTGLVRAVGERRLVEARLTGGFAYAPLPSPVRGPGRLDRANPGDWKVYEAAGKVDAAAARRGDDPVALHTLGLAQLVLGNPDAAVEALEGSTRARPADARALSDLAAAYLARADAAGRADDVVRAIDAARHALALDPGCDEARFNFALALEKQIAGAPEPGAAAPEPGAAAPERGDAAPDPAAAMDAWGDYLRHDGGSPWADEARRRLAALQKASDLLPVPPDPAAVEAAARQGDLEAVTTLVRAGPRIGREVLERRLLPAWAGAERSDPAGAAAALRAARTLAQAIVDLSGDRLGIEAVGAIDAAAGGGARASIASGVEQYARAFARDDAGDVQAAAEGFRSAAQALARGGSPLARAALLRAAICDYYGSPGAGLRLRLDLMGADPANRPYLSLLARVRWMQGLLAAVGGDLSRSYARYEEALALFERTGEYDGVASANFLLAENLDLVGDRESAWRHRARALGLAGRADADRRRSILLEATLAALAQNLPWAALTFHEPLLDPWSTGDPGARSETYTMRARIHDACGDPDGALADLADADRALAGVGDPDLRRRYAAEIAAGRGATLLRHDPGAALEPLRQAGDYFASVGSTSRLAELRLDLGRAHEALGAAADAEKDYDGGIDALEETYARLLIDPHRVSFLDRTWELFDAMIRLQAGGRERPERAFAYAERARRAELLTPEACASPTPASDPPDAAAIARGLPDGVAVLYLVATPDRLLRWVLRAGRVEFRPQPIAPGAIAGLVRDVRNAADGGDEPAFRDAAAALYDLLLRPVETLLAGATEIRFVSDRLLNDVPFAALLDRDGDAFLVERYATGVAPAAASLVAACDHDAHAPAAARAVVVGDPALDETDRALLAPLPAAEAEARQVASLYPGATLLIGKAATAGAFLASIASADVVHFAGHALINERYPLLSALVLAPDPADARPNRVTAFDLKQAAIARARLVVLGACRAAGGGAAHAGGAFSLARPFLAAGVPEVVGTLWAVRDQEAGSILVELHRAYRSGSSAVEGLRQAQLAALRGPDPAARSPLSWGAYVVNGTVLRSGIPSRKEAS